MLSAEEQKFAQEFVAFCRTKGDEEYNPADPLTCALAQFGCVDVQAYDMGEVPEDVFWRAMERNWTFSALADRVEKLI